MCAGFWVFKASHQYFIPEKVKVIAKKINMNVLLFQGKFRDFGQNSLNEILGVAEFSDLYDVNFMTLLF